MIKAAKLTAFGAVLRGTALIAWLCVRRFAGIILPCFAMTPAGSVVCLWWLAARLLPFSFYLLAAKRLETFSQSYSTVKRLLF
jgi:hypothetical protein